MSRDRLSEGQQLAARTQAWLFQQHMTAFARHKCQSRGHDAFFRLLFNFAADQIERDVQAFCDLAEATFEEIEAYGHEPVLDESWLAEVTGEKDSFYFSTDSLVAGADPLKLPRKPKARTTPNEIAVIQAVERAVEHAERALEVVHSEDPTHWIKLIHECLQQADGKLEFWQLQNLTGLSPGALLLALLLRHELWSLEQDGFYGEIQVKLKPEPDGRLSKSSTST